MPDFIFNPEGGFINVILKDSPKKPIGTYFVKVTKIENNNQGETAKPPIVPNNQDQIYFVKVTKIERDKPSP